jgi:hypothetical protein
MNATDLPTEAALSTQRRASTPEKTVCGMAEHCRSTPVISETLTLIESARQYLARGYSVVPLPVRTKSPVLREWINLRLSDDDLPKHFSRRGNIGLLLGEPSRWLVDVDLDCEEAVALAPKFLPLTDAVSGRPGNPRSHWWYISQGAKTRKYQDPMSKKMIAELRSTGTQTVVGPSIHPSGELYDIIDGEPAEVDARTLADAVAALAAAVIEARHGHTQAIDSQTHSPLRDRCAADDALIQRARAYLDHMPPAISGSSGHNATYAAATAIIHGFCLDSETGFSLLWNQYNPRCCPPWSERELRHKISEAMNKSHDKPRGWLRDANAPESRVVDSRTSKPEPSRREDDGSEQQRPQDPGPFPEQLLNVPGFIGQVMAYNLSTATRRQPVLALAAAICLQATLAARKVRDERGNRTNMYCVGIAPSGAGKDHARKVNKNILFAADMFEHEGNEELASDAGLFTAVEAEPAILFQIDEFGRFLRTIGDPKRAPHLFNVLTALMKLYSSADTIFRGKAYADKKKNKVIDQPCVSLYGTTVPENFFESLTAESLSDGFMARLLVFESAQTPARQRATATGVPEAIKHAAAWWGAFRPWGDSSRDHPVPLVVQTTCEASAIFDEFDAMVSSEQNKPGVTARSLWARAEEKACRLALIYACSARGQTPVIDAEAARWACDLSSYLTRRMLHVANEWVAEGAFDARQKRVLRVVREAGGRISRTDLCRKTQWLTQRERHEVIDNLLETQQLHQEAEASPTRPKVVYVLA